MSDHVEHRAVGAAAETGLTGPAFVLARRPVATYSIVARDTHTGQLGVAVQSHWFSVGTIVPWAEAGVGAVATQSMADPSHGPLGLELMRSGRSAPDALAERVAADEGRAVRQIAMIDANGAVAAHTGLRCIAAAGHTVNEDLGVSCQANLMASDAVWGAMMTSYEASLERGDDLAERLVRALEAAQEEGGDIRGKQSAALIVVAGEPTGRPWVDRLFDLRIEDHGDPLAELRRVVTLRRAYRHMNDGDAAIEADRFDDAAREYGAAHALAPGIVEMPFWTAVSLATVGRLDEAMPMFRDVFREEPFWRDLLPKLVESELMPPSAAEGVLAYTGDDVDQGDSTSPLPS